MRDQFFGRSMTLPRLGSRRGTGGGGVDPGLAITTRPVHTVTAIPETAGLMTVTVTETPVNATSLVMQIVDGQGVTTERVLTASAANGAYTADMSGFEGRRVYVNLMGRNVEGDGPSTASLDSEFWPSAWVAGDATVTCRIEPEFLRPGDVAILTLETNGFPEPVIDACALTLNGVAVDMDGGADECVRTFVVPDGVAGQTLALSASVSNTFATATGSATKTISAAIAWGSPIDIADRAALDVAIAAATGGEVLRLAAGSYGTLVWSRGLTTPIKLISASGRTAAFDRIEMTNSFRRNLWLESLTITALVAGNNTNGLTVQNCLMSVVDISAMRSLTITDSEVDTTDRTQCVTLSDVVGGYVADNHFHDSIYDLVRFVGGCSDLVFERNRLFRTTLYPDANYSDNHPDLLQTFGQGSGRTPRRFAIRRNHLYGIENEQGIFNTDPRSADGYKNIVIRNNAVRCSLTNKITVSRLSLNSVVKNNSTNGVSIRYSSTFGGKITKNLGAAVYVDPAYPLNYAQVTDNYAAADVGALYSGDLTELAHFIPDPGLGVDDSYGATVYIKSLASPPEVPEGVLVAASEIRADGWTALTDVSGTDWTPTTDETEQRYFTAVQPGYGQDGLSTTHADRIVVTRQLRTPATTTRVSISALTNYVLEGATVTGATNNSALTGAKPHVRWGLPDRRVVGDTLVAEVVAVHHAARNGQPVAAVTFSATDGTTTVTQTVGTMTISPKSRAGLAVPVYRCSMDISTLDDNADITLNATVYPWIGTATAVRSSTEETDRWRFSPRYYRRSTLDAATPLIAVVKPSTGASGGVVSRDPAVARATPFATITQAMAWFKNNATDIDGAKIWLAENVTGTWATGSSNKIPQRLAAMTISRDPTIARASAVLTGTGGLAYLGRDNTVLGLPVGCIEFNDITIASISTGVQQVGELDFDNVTLSTGFNLSTGSTGRVYELDHTTTSTLGGNVQILRGVIKTNNNNATNGFNPRAVIGSRIGNAGIPDKTVSSITGPQPAFLYCSEFPDWRPDNNSLVAADGECVVQCIIEVMAAGNVNVLAVSSDEGGESTSHYVEMHVTLVGVGPGQTRCNTRYDESSGSVSRTHTYITDKANIWGCGRATKGDLFTGRADRTGNWEFSFGVNCGGNFCYLQFATPASFLHEFDGIGSMYGQVGVSGFPAAGFADNASAGGTTLANGDYSIATGAASPCWNTIPGELLLAYDLRGNPRTQTDAGAIRIEA